jgi:beta-mannosidase
LDVLGKVPTSVTLKLEIMDMSNTTVASGSLDNVTVSGSKITGSITVDGEAC